MNLFPTIYKHCSFIFIFVFFSFSLSGQSQKEAVKKGTMVFNAECNNFQFFNGTGWIPVNGADSVPAIGMIKGNPNPCMNASGESYTVSPLKGAVNYEWKVPPDATITGGQGTTSITVDFGTANGAVFVIAYGKCWRSSGTYLGISLTQGASAPNPGNHLSSLNQITWVWEPVTGALGYRFNAVNDFNTASDLGKNTSKTEKDLKGNTEYKRYLWAYFACGKSAPVELVKSTWPPVLPVVNTVVVSAVTATTATVEANIVSDGGSPVIARGVCYSQTPNPVTRNTKTYHSLKLGAFERDLKNLAPNTVYFARAYAMNSSGVAYGKELIFRTSCASYSPVTISISTNTNAICSGTAVSFCATAMNGGSNPLYQWKVNGASVQGATNATYSYSPSASNVITCMMTSNAECVSGNPALSNTVNLTVNPSVPAGVTVAVSSGQVCEGSEVTFSATPKNGGKNPAYQWKINGKESLGATNASFNYNPGGNDNVTCVMTSDANCVSGNPAVSAPVNVKITPSLPVSATITASSNPFASGSLVTFTANVVNAGNDVTYQWLNNGNVVGGNSATYSCLPWNGDNIICMVKSGQRCAKNNPAFSNNIVMTINRYFPVVNTGEISFSQDDGTISVSGEVTSDGGSPVSSRGVCWSASPGPVITDNHAASGFGSGVFSNNLTGLVSNTRYYLRTYATNSSGTAYGPEISLVTLPVVTTTAVESITLNSVKVGGNITPGGGEVIASRGICYGLKANPVVAGSHTSEGTGTGAFTSELKDLAPGTRYYVRAFAKNAAGIVYGNQQTFATLNVPATVETDAATAISMNSAQSGGKITISGNMTLNSAGLCWSTTPAPTTTGNKIVRENPGDSFTGEIYNLAPNTTYYLRAYFTTPEGTFYGNEISFKTLSGPALPVVTTRPVTPSRDNTLSTGGNVVSDGGSQVTSYGVCWSTNPNPTFANSFTADGSGTGEFSSVVSGIDPSQHYYYRAYAVNGVGIAYGEEMEINKYRIGQDFGGGIIFYIDGTGRHGLIAAASDQSNKAVWGCYGTTLKNTATGIGTGKENTSAVISGCKESWIAAAICNTLEMNGFDDWFLPSKDELNQMFQQRELIGNFNTQNYWSSSENDANFTWYQSFYDGYQFTTDKNLPCNVRAIRAF